MSGETGQLTAKNGNTLNNSHLLSVAGVILLSFGSILYLAIQDYLSYSDEHEHQIIGESQWVALLTKKYFERYQDMFRAIAENECVKKRDGSACSTLFARLNRLFPIAENFAAADRYGRFFASGQPFDRSNPPSLEKFPFFQALRDGASSYVMSSHTGPISGQRVTGIAIPLRTASGEFDGLIGASLKLNEIEALWKGFMDQTDTSILILDRDRNLLSASSRIKHTTDETTLYELVTQGLKQQGDRLILVDGQEFKLYSTISQPSEWLIVALIPTQVPLSSYLEVHNPLMVILPLLMLLLGLSTIAMMRHSVTRARLKQMEDQLLDSQRELQTLNSLELSEQRYQQLFQNAPIALWEEDFTQAMAQVESIIDSGVVDLNAYFHSHPEKLREIAAKVIILDVNKAALAMHEADNKEQLLGSLSKIFNESTYSVFQEEIIALAEGKKNVKLSGEVRTVHGEKRFVVARIFRLGEAGEFGRILIATSDVTQLTQTEEALRRSQKMEAIGQITGGIAHDFNNILGIIIGNLDLLKAQLKGEEKTLKRVDTSLQAALRAANLTRQLLGFSRQQSQESELLNLNELLNDVTSLIDRSVTPLIEVKYEHAEELWPVRINSGDFKDSLLNLVLNAKDAMPEGGQLSLRTFNRTLNIEMENGSKGPSRDFVAVEISDTGCGIPADDINRIFEPFYTTKPTGKGTGLGLSMVFGFIKRSNGEIRVASEPGNGTTITLLLPRAEGAVKRDAKEVVEKYMAARTNKTILVVDDESALLELAKSNLESWGYKVIAVNSPQEALRQLERNPQVDLLFTDIVMPGGMSGYELAEAAERMSPNLKLLFTSGYTRQEEQQQSRFRQSATLGKPYKSGDLSVAVRQLLAD